jgi:hypothetical protein
MKPQFKTVLFLFVCILCIPFFSQTFRRSLSSTLGSWISPIDNQYIIAEAEWLSESGGIIRFDNGFSILRNDTIYSSGEPKRVVINLNKYFNEMTTRDLKTNKITKYTSTRELLR